MSPAAAGSPTAARTPMRASGFFAFRTPLLPFTEFTRWTDGLAAAACLRQDDEQLTSAIKADRDLLWSRLAAVLDRPAVKEALFVASQDLSEAFATWKDAPGHPRNRRAGRSLVRYFARMVARPTPFGLFAGCSVGLLGPETRLTVGPAASYRRHVRLDVNYLIELSEALVRDPALQAKLVYRPNSSLYRSCGRLRYVESSITGGYISHRLVAVEESPSLMTVLERSRAGATPEEMATWLMSDEITAEDAAAYVQDLVRAKVLVPDLAPVVTGPEPVHELLRQLGHPAASDVRCRIETAMTKLSELNDAPLGVTAGRYDAVAEILRQLPVPLKSVSKALQVDMLKPALDATLGMPVIDEITSMLMLVHGLRRTDDPFRAFRERFRERYEGQEVPLLEALDEESGIGLAPADAADRRDSPLLDGLRFSETSGRAEPWEPLDALLLAKLTEAVSSSRHVMQLKPEELNRARGEEPLPLPQAFCVFATVVASSREALARGEFEVLWNGTAGPSGARLLGRFCHVDPVLLNYVRGHLEEEEAAAPEALYAEVVHLPEGRVGNVILRPLLRRYEIPYLGRSGAPDHQQILAADLVVSVEGDRIVLRSKRLGREVIPRLTSAHNSGRGLSVYRFLCALQNQGVSLGFSWNWGRLAASPFLPRVVLGRTILSRARWRVHGSEVQPFLSVPEAVWYRRVASWREARRIPRLVSLVDGDQKLLFDLENVLSTETLIAYVNRRSSFVLEEFYPGPDALCCSGPEGAFLHEVVVPFVRTAPGARLAVRTPRPQTPPSDRHFPPGSEWLYTKLYAGRTTADRVLSNTVAPLVRKFRTERLIDGWFFVRYQDPHPHLRIRLHGTPSILTEKVLPRIKEVCSPLLHDGTLNRLQLDTYQREVERYGGLPAMRLAERFFCLDSEAFLEILEAQRETDDPDAIWPLGLLGMDLLLRDFGFNLEARLRIAEDARGQLLQQLHVDHATFRRILGRRFRVKRTLLERLFAGERDRLASLGLSSLAEAALVLQRRSAVFRSEVAVPLRSLASAGLATPFEHLVRSYLHMHVNRFSRSAPQEHELVFYDFLTCLYESQVARRRNVLAGQ